MEEVRGNGFDVMVITIEISSQGFAVWTDFGSFMTSPLPHAKNGTVH